MIGWENSEASNSIGKTLIGQTTPITNSHIYMRLY